MSGDYGSEFVSAKCIADKGMMSPSLVMLLDEPQANPHLLLHCCAHSTGSVALIFAPALPDIRGGASSRRTRAFARNRVLGVGPVR